MLISEIVQEYLNMVNNGMSHEDAVSHLHPITKSRLMSQLEKQGFFDEENEEGDEA